MDTVLDLIKKINKKEVSSKEIVQDCLRRINKYDKSINAFISINSKAEAQAEQIDQRINKGEKVGALAGIPIAIKDLLCTEAIVTTAGSKILSNFKPTYSATVVNKLKQAGAIVIGKTNLDEFAMGSSNETSYYGVCKNPWNQDYVPGGSSGGSAAALAAQMIPAAIGTDTGGSIRQPASYCGVVGIKPTYGRVSRYGIIAFASSLDQAGTMARTTKDAALIMQNICGQDSFDSTTANVSVPDWCNQITGSVKGLKVGLVKEFLNLKLDSSTEKVFNDTIEYLKKQGVEILDISLSMVEQAVATYYLIATSEASSNLSRYDGIKYGHRADVSELKDKSLENIYKMSRGQGFGAEVKRRIMLGTYALSSGYFDAYYLKACQVRRLLHNQLQNCFKKVDVLLNPVTTNSAFKIGEHIDDPIRMYKNDLFTTLNNLCGLPGMSVPAGFSDKGLPIGIQITAQHFNEIAMLNMAEFIQEISQSNQRVANGFS